MRVQREDIRRCFVKGLDCARILTDSGSNDNFVFACFLAGRGDGGCPGGADKSFS